MTSGGRRAASRRVTLIVGAYVAFAATWIVVSDRVVSALGLPPRTEEYVHTGKGWFFVAVTSWLLFTSLQRVTRRLSDSEAAARIELEDRVRMEQAHAAERRATEERWVLALEAAGHGVWDHDARAGRTYFSPVWKSMLGYADGDISDDPGEWERLVHPDDLAGCLGALERFLAGETTSYRSEHRMIARDGSHVWVLDQGNVVEWGPDGRPLRLLGTHTDVTWRVVATEELDRHRHRLAELVRERTAQLAQANAALEARAAEVADLYDRAPCGYHSVDARGAIVEMNATELAWLGYDRSAVIGRHITELLAPESVLRFRQNFAVLLAAGAVRDVELTFERRDGTLLPAVVNATVVRDAEGRLTRTRSTVFDDTERQEHHRRIAALNAELSERAEEADAANRAKSIFLATMSHEMRTPLHAIVGYAHLLRDTPPGPERTNQLDHLCRAVTHLTRVVDDVLDLSRIESGRVELVSVPVDVRCLVDEAIALVADDAGAKGLRIEVDVDDAVPDTLVGDPTRLRQLVLNYVANAVKYTDRGDVRVHASVEPDPADPGALFLRVAVRDTGPGIAAADQALLFRDFERLDHRAADRGGSGLGLAISRRLAVLLGGTVGVSSVPGEGSTFWFTARVARTVRSETARPLPAGGRGLEGDVLVAEDDPMSREVVVALLVREGLRVDCVGDGARAVDLATARPYDLVLMDLHMPVLDGLGAIRRIRQHAGDVDLPIVAMTADAFSEDRAACLAAGADEHLPKPITPDALRATLQRWLAPRRAGLSRAAGLRSTDGDEALHARWLAVFAETHGPTPELLRDPALSGRDLEDVVHRLKGSAGLVGAVEVAAGAGRLVALLRAGRRLDDAAVVDERAGLAAALDRALAHVAAAGAADDAGLVGAVRGAR